MDSSASCRIDGVTAAPQQNGKDYWKYGRNIRGAGDIHSNACDIVRWDRAFFGEKVLGEEMMAHVLGRDRTYSCGWNLENDGTVLTYMGATDACGLQTTVYRTEKGNIYLVELIPDTRKGPELHNAMKIVESFVMTEQE